MRALGITLATLLLVSCSAIPEGIRPVENFELEKYQGKWFEIARLNHRFERGLEKVTATYTLNDDGTVQVLNKGFLKEKGKWKEAIGKAKFSGAENIGHLKVSFFGPFYGSYVVFDLDQKDYQHAFVTSGQKYLWLLSRTSTVSDEVKNRFIKRVTMAGYNTDELIFVNHD